MEINSDYKLPPQTTGAQAGQEITENREALHRESQMVVQTDETPEDPKALLTDLLKTYGLKVDAENIRMLEALVDNNFPLNKETVAAFNRALKLLGGGQTDKALFLLENEIRPTAKNTALLNRFAEGGVKITEQLTGLAESLDSLADHMLKEKIEGIFLGRYTQNSSQNGKLFIDSALDGLGENTAGNVEADNTEVIKGPFDTRTGIHETELPNQVSSQIQDGVSKDILGAEQMIREGERPVDFGSKEAMDRLAVGERAAELTFDEASEISEKIVNAIKDGRVALKDRETLTIELEELLKETVKSFADVPEHTREKIIKELVERIFSGEEQEPLGDTRTHADKSIRQRLLARFFFPISKSHPEDVDKFLNELRDNLNEAKDLLARQEENNTEIARAIRDIDNIREHIDFVAHLKNNLFVQLPLTVGGEQNNAELLIFRDGKRGKKNAIGTLSALIALDTSRLGRFEAYVQKSERRVNCQFRLANTDVERMVRINLHKLDKLLGDYGYGLDGVTFKQLEEAFTLMDKEPDGEDGILPTDERRRIVFDVKM